MAREIKTILGTQHPLVCDIAANDGCLLEQFRDEGFHTVGVEPSKNLAEECAKKGLSVVDEFWDEETSARVPASDVITATNVLAHVDDVKTFVSLAKRNLRSFHRGIMVVEVPYAANLINYVQFDTIYHEHLSYFLFRPLVRLFKDAGMPIFRVKKVPIHGGSLRIYASPHDRPEERSVSLMLEDEERVGLWNPETYKEFSENTKFVMADLPFLLFSLKRDGKKVIGYCASAKGVSLLNYCGITSDDLPLIVDETLEKQGRNTPGSNIPIVSFEAFELEKPDYILILAWNFKEELMAKTKRFGAKYIIPIPTVEIL